MEITFLSLNPEFFEGFLKEGILKNAISKGIIKINFINIRDFTLDKHSCADDTPYGGGSGMLLKPEPIVRAFESIELLPRRKVIMPCPDGREFNSAEASKLSDFDQLIFICGRYEGIDERASEILNPEKISVGNYVLSNGELAALVIFNSAMRNIPGVLGNSESLKSESFSIFHDSGTAIPEQRNSKEKKTAVRSCGSLTENSNPKIFDNGIRNCKTGNFNRGIEDCAELLEYPQYTRPDEYRGIKVPDVLREGNHKLIAEWMIRESVKKTERKLSSGNYEF
ncbi:MAG TPA: tRNA (guanine(37)-N(1))-methyltransferase [bacterium]|nr:tRNA (guanine(37)-N(1))-methyltransferase [bacterium]HPN29630.1 tRNA (guanine(37)-N(1))-methyltransferase [bacterium]